MTTTVKTLTDLDYEVLNLIYVEGQSVKQVAEASGLTIPTIRKLLERPEVQPLIEEHLKINEAELLGLEVRATQVLREHMSSESPEIQQKAIDKVFKRRGSYKQSVDVNITAEDVIKRFIENDESTESNE